MDILRKELNDIYASQHLENEELSPSALKSALDMARNLVEINNGCAVITDASSDQCYIFSGDFAVVSGLSDSSPFYLNQNSSDEDIIYEKIHPEDLVDKRFLEYEFFKTMEKLPIIDKLSRIAKCRIRLADKNGNYLWIDNTTQLIKLSPAGKIWLILCTYNMSSTLSEAQGITPLIIDTSNGEITRFSFGEQRKNLLTKREREILLLIKKGKASKQIADILGISIHTVNRHRQNVIEKLSVGNSIEAVTAATVMGLI